MELFNQTTVTSISDSDRIAFAVPSQSGAHNIIYSVFKALVNYWTAVSGGINYTGGNVGINTTPSTKLEILQTAENLPHIYYGHLCHIFSIRCDRCLIKDYHL